MPISPLQQIHQGSLSLLVNADPPAICSATGVYGREGNRRSLSFYLPTQDTSSSVAMQLAVPLHLHSVDDEKAIGYNYHQTCDLSICLARLRRHRSLGSAGSAHLAAPSYT